MPCRVGMTQDLEERKQYWQRRHPRMTGWTVIATYSRKSDAQARETSEARARGCLSGTGGTGPEYATWYVYYFRY